MHGIGVGFIKPPAAFCGNKEFIAVKNLYVIAKALPHALVVELFHGGSVSLPIVEIADYRNAFCMRRPDSENERIAICPVRAEKLLRLIIAPLVEHKNREVVVVEFFTVLFVIFLYNRGVCFILSNL